MTSSNPKWPPSNGYDVNQYGRRAPAKPIWPPRTCYDVILAHAQNMRPKRPLYYFLLQETHSTIEITDDWTAEWGKRAYFSGNKSNSQIVCILINHELNCDGLTYFDIVNGRLQAIELKINHKKLTVVNIYGPNNDEVSLFEKLEEFISLNNDKSLIIGGDFNTFIDIDMYRKNGQRDCHKNIRKIITSLINTNCLIDIWRVQHPNIYKYTWHSNTKPVIFSRLDYF